MTTTTAAALTRREADRTAYLACQRAAHQMRLDAEDFRLQAINLTAPAEVYGTRADDYKAGVAARLELVAGWCDAEADRQQQYADSYRQILGLA